MGRAKSKALSSALVWKWTTQIALYFTARRQKAREDNDRPASVSTMAILRAMVDSSVDGILIVDAEGKILLKNRRMAEVWGIPDDIFASNDDSKLLGSVLDSVRDPVGFLATVESLYANPLAAQHDEIELTDGRVIERHTGPAVEADGAVHGRVWNFRDVTERIEAKKRLEEANRLLSDLATLDALTGLKNRRAFDEAIERAFSEASRSGLPVSVLMIDVDRFKSVNDRFGHDAGDDALRRVARTLAQTTPEGSLAARYGGEEFAALLPGLDERKASEVAERIRAAVEETAFGHGPTTVSIGVATCDGRDASATDVVQRADRALYAAKRAGRNQVRSESAGA